MRWLIVALAALILNGWPTGGISGTDDFVIVDLREAAYTVFASFPEKELEAVKAQLGNGNVSAVSMQEFKSNVDKFVRGRIVKDDYPGSEVVSGIVALLQKYPRIPIGLTWNGGVAITHNDYQHAKKTYQKYLADPSGYERTRTRAPRLDPVNPMGHLGSLLGR